MDNIKHPEHYTSHPSKIECIEITKHFNFCMGNAIKYIWRADEKGNAIQDLKKAIQYLEFEIDRRMGTTKPEPKCNICGAAHDTYRCPSINSRGNAKAL